MATAFPARIRSDAKRCVYFYPCVFYRHLQRPDELDVYILYGVAPTLVSTSVASAWHCGLIERNGCRTYLSAPVSSTIQQ